MLQAPNHPEEPLKIEPAEPEIPQPKPVDTAPTLRAGARLTKRRMELGLSINQIADRIRIRTDYLAALEAMNVKLLPGKAYANAYLRSYAKALDLPVDEIAAQFQRECALTREDADPQLRNPESKPDRERPWLAAVALVIVAVVFVGWRAYIDSQPEPAAKTAKAPVTAPATAGEDANVAREVASDPFQEPFGLAAQAVYVKALSDQWLEVRGPDGTIFRSGVVKAGANIRLDAGAGWTLHARDGAAFEVYVNGNLVGLLGAAGAPVLGRRVDAIAAAALQG
jgi:cytoskeletal protein RodZ